MESLLSDYSLSPEVVLQIDRRKWIPIGTQVLNITVGSEIYVPGIGVFDVERGERLDNALFGFFVIDSNLTDGFRKIKGAGGSFFLSERAVVITHRAYILSNS